jgi:hypothetical protein
VQDLATMARPCTITRRARTGSLDNAAFRAYPDEEGVSDRSRPILRQADPANWKGERFKR